MPVRQPPLRAIFAALCGALALGACAPRVEPAGPFLSPPQLKDDRIVAADGAILPLRRWMPDRPPRAVILALHGFNDYSRAFERSGEYWAKKRIATYAYDQRGFGKAPHRGIWAGHETMAADAAAVLDLVRARHPGVPVYVLGESMGGAIAMIAAPTLRADGLVLVAPALRGRRQLGLLASAALWLATRTIPWYPLTAEGLNVQASDNIRMLRELGRDPLIIKRTRIDAVEGLVNAMDAALAAAPRLPSLVLFGARDELVPPEPALALFRRTRARVTLYRDGWHMLLRDLNAQVALDDIAAWIEDPTAPLPSDAPPRLDRNPAPRGRRSRFRPGSFAVPPDSERRTDRDMPPASRLKALAQPVSKEDRRPPALHSAGIRPFAAKSFLDPCATQAGFFRKVRLYRNCAECRRDAGCRNHARSRVPDSSAEDSRPRPALRGATRRLRAATQLAKELRPAAF